MKGTLFSADFAKDSNNNLRLLEINTDTAFTTAALAHVDFTEFINVLTSNDISEVHVIFKPFQRDFVEELAKGIVESGHNILLTESIEDINSIYPAAVEDSDSKFILRLAYDETAIFDSVYCRQKNQLLELFHENNNTTSVPGLFLSSSTVSINTLDLSVNENNVPDIAVKNLTEVHKDIEFYKVAGTGSIEENYADALGKLSTDKIVINYYDNSAEGTHKAQRSFNIIYGENLDILNLVDVEVDAILEKPTTLTFDSNETLNLLDEKHYYEFTSNFPKVSQMGVLSGIFEDEEVTDINGNPVRVSDLVIGDTYKALAISGSPDSDLPDVYTEWFFEGSEMPQNDITSSVLINKVDYPLTKKLVNNITLENSASFRANPLQSVLVYDTVDNGFRYKHVYDIDPTNDQLIKLDSSKVNISTNEIEVLEGEHKTYLLDFETADTFVLHDSELNLKIVAHNCFPAGTRILLADGTYKNIEDITPEDSLTTYNNETGEYNSGKPGSIRVTTQNKLVEIETENGEKIKTTPGHKFFVEGDWKIAGDLKVGDLLFFKGGTESPIKSIESLDGEFEVFHLIDVEGDHTYFAENILVHNFKGTLSCFVAGTIISTTEGETKMIQDIKAGDEVMSLNESEGVQELKKVYEVLQPVHNDLVTYTLEDGSTITSTFDHPYYVEGMVFKSYNPHKTNAVYDLPREVSQIEVGDKFIKQNGEFATITKIEELTTEEVTTYLLRVEDNHNFYANGLLVHNK